MIALLHGSTLRESFSWSIIHVVLLLVCRKQMHEADQSKISNLVCLDCHIARRVTDAQHRESLGQLPFVQGRLVVLGDFASLNNLLGAQNPCFLFSSNRYDANAGGASA